MSVSLAVKYSSLRPVWLQFMMFEDRRSSMTFRVRLHVICAQAESPIFTQVNSLLCNLVG